MSQKPHMEDLPLINLTVNGQTITVNHCLTLADFLNAKNINMQHVAIAYNGEVIPKDCYTIIMLKANDVLEIVRPVGGG